METKIPKTDLVAQLTGEDVNVFNLCGIATKAIKKIRCREYATELSERLWEKASYDEALKLFMEYVKVA